MYTKIDSRFWEDEKILQLDPDARYLMLYLLTTKHRNMLGCYHLPKDYARFDSKLTPKRFEIAWKSVIKSGMVLYDESLRVVLVKNFLKYNPIENPKQVIGATTKLNDLPRTPILAELQRILDLQSEKEYLKPLSEALRVFLLPLSIPSPASRETVAERVSETLSDSLSDGYGKQVEVLSRSTKYEEKENLFVVGGEARAGASEEAVEAFLEERGQRPERYFGFTSETQAQAERIAGEIFTHYSLKPPTKMDVTTVFEYTHTSIPPADPYDHAGWRIEFPKDKIDLLMYAFEAAAAVGSPGNWNYIRGVMGKLHGRRITNLEQAEDFDFTRTERRSP